VAVVQISKIQIRRGQKSQSGIPQLSSAEFAWSIDTQELFIGNGAVAEGAPYVGNTKILTEHDNILELSSSYIFGGTDVTIVKSVGRPLQEKLDEYVSVLDYGAVPDGSTDCVSAFEDAFEDLFRNADDRFKKKLLIPNGRYLFSSDLRIPSSAILEGENFQKSILDIGSNNILFVSETGDGIVDFTSSNRPEQIKISNVTIERTTGQVVLSGVKDSGFSNVRFLGNYELGQSTTAIAARPASVSWENNLAGIKVDNVIFDQCFFEYTQLAVRCDQTALFDSKIVFRNCRFFVCNVGIYVNGFPVQGTFWEIDRCEFREIYNQAVLTTQGRGTIIQSSSFVDCGNNLGDAASPVTSIVEFGDPLGNVVTDCKFNRHQSAFITAFNTTVAIPEVLNASRVVIVDRNYSDIFLSDSFRPLTVFSAYNKFISVDYMLSLGDQNRVGKLTMVIDRDLQVSTLSDSFEYSSQTPTSPGGALMTNFQFDIELRNNANYGDSSLGDNRETLVLYYKNPISSGSTGTVSYSVTYGV
jgi:hypothetical protein